MPTIRPAPRRAEPRAIAPRRCAVAATTLLALAGAARPSHAWLLHEHARIGQSAIQGHLGQRERQVLDAAWSLSRSRVRAPRRLCPAADALWQAKAEPCVGFSTLPALAGDHSCSPDDLEATLSAAWLPAVLAEASRIHGALVSEERPVTDRLDERRRHDIDLQLADPDYLGRADGSGAHFQLPRNGSERPGAEVIDYLLRALAIGQRPNATALYVNYHAAAVALALEARAACAGQPGPCEAAGSLVWRALRAEAFALHFLQDGSSAGHLVGTWGNQAQRIGTHDFYCQHGIEVRLFDGSLTYVAHGDAFMTDDDLLVGARASAASLAQVLRAMDPAARSLDVEGGVARLREALTQAAPDGHFDACAADRAPPAIDRLAYARLATEAVSLLPAPTLDAPPAPRFTAEAGLFFGATLSGDVAGALTPDAAHVDLRVRAGVRLIGFGLEGILSRYMDGRLFLDALYAGSWRAGGQVTSGFGGRAHVPFAVVPLDGLVAPLAFTGWRPAVWIARQASHGSIWGRFEQVFLLSEGHTLQITLGREATLLYYPGPRGEDSRRFELLLSGLQLRMGRAFGGRVANDFLVELGAQMILPVSGEQPAAYGPYMAFSADSRFYP